jgi:hypothetical protein
MARKQSRNRGRAAFVLLVTLALLLIACAKTNNDPAACEPGVVHADHSTDAPLPEESSASFHFPGNMPEQREFVWLRGDGRYDYAERWHYGVPGDKALQGGMGWDWKTGCRMKMCPLPDGSTCCYQVCVDGGDSGVGMEPPEQFACMNSAAGGRYDWFIDGLLENGMSRLEACRTPPSSSQPPPSSSQPPPWSE